MFLRQRQILSEVIAAAGLRAELTRLLPDAGTRTGLLEGMQRVHDNVDCPHNVSHVLSFVVALFSQSPAVEGVIVEAGCYKGGSTAKLSLAASLLNRKLVVFDSFQGLPKNAETHQESILGHSIDGWFTGGNFSGALDEVRSNVESYGNIAACRFVPGWFEDTMPSFPDKIAAAYIDVDLASSTRTCLKHLYPRLSPGGVLVSQDGDFPLVIEVLRDRDFWESEVRWPMPAIAGLGSKKMLTMVKPADAVPM